MDERQKARRTKGAARTGLLWIVFLSACSSSARSAAALPPNAPATATSRPAPTEPVVDLPHSPLGQLARALVGAVNVGKLDAQRDFVRTHMSASALDEAPIDEWAAFLQSMSTESGGIDVVRIAPEPVPNHLSFRV